MKFGVREICDVVLRAKTAQKIGNKIFYKNEPVCYFDTLKTSTLEGAATTVYATGGRGNARLMSWDGERTVTFTMEDALISPIGLSILTGAGLIEGSNTHPVYQHVTETISKTGDKWYLSQIPYDRDDEISIYGMIVNDNGEVVSEPYLFKYEEKESSDGHYNIVLAKDASNFGRIYSGATNEKIMTLGDANILLVDYYVQHISNSFEINISPSQFGGSFYLEASTLWRDQNTGKDLPAEFIIPNCRIQSNFSFSMSSSGDPSTFTFTVDAFPDYTRWNKTEKVLADIQIIGANLNTVADYGRPSTWTEDTMINNELITQKNTDYYKKLVITTLNRTKAGAITFVMKDENIYGEGQSDLPNYGIRYILQNDTSTVATGLFTNDTDGVILAKSSYGNYGAWTVTLTTVLSAINNIDLENNKEYSLQVYCENFENSKFLSPVSAKIYIPIYNAEYLSLRSLIKDAAIEDLAIQNTSTLPISTANGTLNLKCSIFAEADVNEDFIEDIGKIAITTYPKTVRSLEFYLNNSVKVTEKIDDQKDRTLLSTENIKKNLAVDFINDYLKEKFNPKIYVRYKDSTPNSTNYEWVLANDGTTTNVITNSNLTSSVDVNRNIFTPLLITGADAILFAIVYEGTDIKAKHYLAQKEDSNYKIYQITAGLKGGYGSTLAKTTPSSGYQRYSPASSTIEGFTLSTPITVSLAEVSG